MTLPESTPQPGTFPTERDPRLKLIIPGVVGVAFLMEQLDTTILVTAIPAMAASLATTPLRMNLALTAYILSLALFIPVSGWFADRFGARRVFVAALAVFMLSSMLSGAATSLEMLIVTRAMQGFGGAMMIPVGRLILLRSFPRSQLVTAMSYMTVPAVVGPMLGPLLGGFLTTYFHWRAIFFVNVPFALLGILAAWRFVEEVKVEASPRFDLPGFLMVGTGLVLLQFGIENIARPRMPGPGIAAMFVVGALVLAGFGLYARRVAAPAVDLTLFRNRAFRIATLAGGLCRIGINGVPFLLPLMLQLGFGLSPVASGWLTFASAATALAVRPLCSAGLRLYGFDRVLAGTAILGSAAMAGFALMTPETPHWFVALYVVFYGAARGSQFMTSNTLAYADTPPDQLSRATSLGGVLQQLTISFGVALAAMLLGLLAPEGTRLNPEHFHIAFLIMAAIPLVSVPWFLRLRPEDGAQVSRHFRRPKSR